MKHQFVDETLLTGERIAPFAILAQPGDEPLPKPTRAGLLWDGPCWSEFDPRTGQITAKGADGWSY